MQVNDVIHGFQVKRVRSLEELGGDFYEMEHLRTGAQLAWLARPDENKTFSIAFKTLPEDSTGVFHILEHSVLCGSDKYPLKEPFVELLKSSVQTFLNAMTYPDKTVYPVSTRNDQDFLNLMDVYLDAVLHPAIYHKPEIFRQEGWRYEGEGEGLCYQGVVFNEMKGSMSSPTNVLFHEALRLLFPDNCYRHNSGGDPAVIPDLSYAQFLACHRKYYHPSNSRISLVGSVDMDAALARIDGYLSAFDKLEADFTIPMQKPVEAVTQTVPYEIGEEEDPAKRAIISSGGVLGDYSDQLRTFTAAVLTDYLTGDNEAPLKRAVIDKGLAQDFTLSLEDGIQQPLLFWMAMNTEEEALEPLRAAVRETLEKLVSEGLDKERLRACFHRFAFRKRDRESGSEPRSLLEAITLLDTWLYGGDPAAALMVEGTLKELEEKLEAGWFERFIREFFLENEHTVTLVMVPSKTLAAQRREKEAARLHQESEGWAEADKERLKAEAEALQAWQQTPDSEEALKTIPMLKLSDLAEKPEPLQMTETVFKGVPALRHVTGSAIAYFRAIFRATELTSEELPVLYVLSQVLGSMGTKKHDRAALTLAIKDTLGHLYFAPGIAPGSDPQHCIVTVSFSAACLREQSGKAAALVGEILRETVFEDMGLLRDILQQASVAAKMTLASNGLNYALTRALGNLTAQGAASEQLSGVSFLRWLEKTLEEGDEALRRLLDKMAVMAGKLFTRERVTLSLSEAFPDEAAALLLDCIPSDGCTPPKETAYSIPGAKREGLAIPAQVSFAVMSSNFFLHDRKYSGCIPVLSNVLNYGYLWNEIRVQGGAYGCGFIGRDSGDTAFYTYRDPQPGRSLEVIAKAADFLRSFCASDPDLTGFILSSVSAVDPLRNSTDKMNAGEKRYLWGITQEDVDKRYHDLVHTTPDDLLALCGMLEDIAAERSVCVAAGKDLLTACGDALDTVMTV